MEVEVLYDEGCLAMGVVGNVFLGGWRDAPTMKTLLEMESVGRAVARDTGPLALLNVAFSGTPSFSNDVRRTSARLTADPDLFEICRTHVTLIAGLTGAAVRAFMNTFILLGRPPRPTKLLGSLDEALAWSLPHLRAADGPRWTEQTLRPPLQQLAELCG